MVAKGFLIADIFAEHLERLVPAMLLHLEQIGALPPRLGQKAGAQTMPGKEGGIIAGRNGPRGKDVLRLHDMSGITLEATRPMALQVDGDHVGAVSEVRLESVSRALRVLV